MRRAQTSRRAEVRVRGSYWSYPSAIESSRGGGLSRDADVSPLRETATSQPRPRLRSMARRLPWSRNIDRHGTRAFQLAAVAYVWFGVLDCVTTAVALGRGGREGNRLAASIYEQYGIVSLFALKAV